MYTIIDIFGESRIAKESQFWQEIHTKGIDVRTSCLVIA